MKIQMKIQERRWKEKQTNEKIKKGKIKEGKTNRMKKQSCRIRDLIDFNNLLQTAA
jgi:hypothetical protein